MKAVLAERQAGDGHRIDRGQLQDERLGTRLVLWGHDLCRATRQQHRAERETDVAPD